ncbi:PAS domain S-box protein [Spirulina sp. CS-785/01]|uniref:PAS domain-containing sensor histidine kinase n=1 Tax=Spirulina sp. CS-785/01 TaxID=3021716 RepID=UPI00232BF789|nr:PAS domain S-box protein [Spirulina sp. CS-785/01]MDB9312194.1 PAS domain S-box protein [Spirulina sp. CS-785/01]
MSQEQNELQQKIADLEAKNYRLEQQLVESQQLYQKTTQTLQKTQQELQNKNLCWSLSEKFLRLAMDHLPEAAFWKDRNSVYLGCNQRFAHIAGVNSPSEIIGKTDYELPWKREETDWFRDCDQRVMESNQAELGIIEPQQQADGSQHWLETNKIPLHDETNQVIGILGTFIDITPRKTIENALVESEERFRVVCEQTGQLIYDFDVAAERITWAGAITKITGYAVEEFQESTLQEWEDHIHPEDRTHALELLEQAMANCCNYRVEYRWRQKGGDYIFVEDNGTFLTNEAGEAYRMLGTMTNISDRKQAETAIQQKTQELQNALQKLQSAQLQIVQNEKMASLGNLVAGVAHEINNPLGFLNGSLYNIREQIEDVLNHLQLYQSHYPQPAPALQENAEDIDLEFIQEDLPTVLPAMEKATNRIKAISNSLRTFSRADTDYQVRANLHDGLDSTLLILKYRLKAKEERPAIEIIRNYGDLPEILCFPGQLNQVFMNLLANAVDMFDEMAQDIPLDSPTITLSTAIVEDQVQIQIADNGKGMTEEMQQQVFNPLFTTKAVGEGTGLGLAIARQIVENKHGGHLSVASILNQGTTFTVRFPWKG